MKTKLSLIVLAVMGLFAITSCNNAKANQNPISDSTSEILVLSIGGPSGKSGIYYRLPSGEEISRSFQNNWDIRDVNFQIENVLVQFEQAGWRMQSNFTIDPYCQIVMVK